MITEKELLNLVIEYGCAREVRGGTVLHNHDGQARCQTMIEDRWCKIEAAIGELYHERAKLEARCL